MDENAKNQLRTLVSEKYNELLQQRGLSDVVFSTSFKLTFPEYVVSGMESTNTEYVVVPAAMFEILRDAFENVVEELIDKLKEER